MQTSDESIDLCRIGTVALLELLLLVVCHRKMMMRMTTTMIASAVSLGIEIDSDNETFPHRENSRVVNSHQSTTLSGRFAIVENSDLSMGFSQQHGCGQSTFLHRENSLVVNSHQSTTLTGRFAIVKNSDLSMGFSQQQGCGQSTYS
eukprot:scaffold12586_cov76-Cylindrotheca_fusiformis.AAC.1